MLRRKVSVASTRRLMQVALNALALVECRLGKAKA
jgi:hypothetical protein